VEETRDRWSGRTAFVMAAIGSAVGLGNVWRFPVTCYKYGGGAFFIPYFVALLTAGVPLMILEFGIGQMMQGSAPASLRKVNRHTEWVGWFALLVGLVISIYYALIMAYAVEYLVYSVKGFFTQFSQGCMPWSVGSEGEFFKENIQHYSAAAGEMWTPVWGVIAGLVITWAAVFFIHRRSDLPGGGSLAARTGADCALDLLRIRLGDPLRRARHVPRAGALQEGDCGGTLMNPDEPFVRLPDDPSDL